MVTPASAAPTLASAIAVNTHMNYAAYQDVEQVTALVKSLGVKYVRDGLHYWGNNDAMNVLYSSLVGLGVNFNFVVDPSENLGTLTSAMLTEYDWLSDRRIRYFEGPNEMDQRGANWVADTRAFQQQLRQASTLAQGLVVGLIAPSLALTSNAAQLGDLTSDCDYGNLHAYAARAPEGFLLPLLSEVSAVSGSKPVIVTECGYFTAGQGSVSEAAQAKYILRMMLSYFSAGAKQIYIYELLDQEPAATVTDAQLHFGLVRSDGTEKPSFGAVKNLISILGTGYAQLIPLNYSLSGAAVQSLLLQSGPSEWLLFLWQAADLSGTNPDVQVTLSLPKPYSCSMYTPLLQMEPMEALTASSIPLSVPDHPIAVRING